MIFMCFLNPFKEAAKQHRNCWCSVWRSVLFGRYRTGFSIQRAAILRITDGFFFGGGGEWGEFSQYPQLNFMILLWMNCVFFTLHPSQLTFNNNPVIRRNLTHVKMVKVKCSRYRPGVVQRVGKGIALLSHDRGTRRWWVVTCTPRRTLPPGKTRYSLYRRLGGPQGRSGRAENLVHTGIRSRTVQPVVSRYTD